MILAIASHDFSYWFSFRKGSCGLAEELETQLRSLHEGRTGATFFDLTIAAGLRARGDPTDGPDPFEAFVCQWPAVAGIVISVLLNCSNDL